MEAYISQSGLIPTSWRGESHGGTTLETTSPVDRWKEKEGIHYESKLHDW